MSASDAESSSRQGGGIGLLVSIGGLRMVPTLKYLSLLAKNDFQCSRDCDTSEAILKASHLTYG